MFKWNNNFAWVYNGSVADSFKEKVKAAGGNVDGFMRCSLHWFNYDDLHVTEPGGREIYYGSKTGYTGGTLDVDMNAGSGKTRDAVENIIWTDPSRLRPGDYVVRVHNFYKRESGLTVCTCCEFPGTAWLVFRPNMPTSDIHGEGYDFEEIGLFGTEAVLKYFEANTPNYVDCGTDVDKFINICLQFK